MLRKSKKSYQHAKPRHGIPSTETVKSSLAARLRYLPLSLIAILALAIWLGLNGAFCLYYCEAATCERSCSVRSRFTSDCCVEWPGGLLVVAQTWNWDPGSGPQEEWTLGGLCPTYCGGDGTCYSIGDPEDFCRMTGWDIVLALTEGSYHEYCDPEREYTDIEAILRTKSEIDMKWLEHCWLVVFSHDGPV
jgi:hypothetical protein